MNFRKLCDFRKLFVLFFIFLYASTVFAVIEQSSLKIFAVTDSGTGLAADLALKIKPGTGKITTDLSSLVGTTTQASMRTAVKVASNYSDEAYKNDYEFDINADASLVDGPSAGGAMTLLVISALQDKKIPKEVGMTGTITSDGGIGPVGGVFHKAKKASEEGIKLFMIPQGEEKQIVSIENKLQSVYLPTYAFQEWKIKVLPVASIDDVLKYAFSDINSIDLNDLVPTPLEEFVPSPAEKSDEVLPLANITQKYIDESKEVLNQAKKSIEVTDLEDPALIDILLATLNNAESTIAQAELVYSQNYYYSSANFAFIAKVNSQLVKDIADNPSIISTSSNTIFDSKINDLSNKIRAFKENLSNEMPLDGHLEWFISAQQRLTWAELTIEKIQNTQTVVINQDPGSAIPSVDKYSSEIDKLRDYEFALAWYEVSVDLYNQTVQEKDTKFVEQKELFRESIDNFLIDAENGLTVLKNTGQDYSDIERRINGAKKNLLEKWYSASLFDSASALALVNSEITLNNMEDQQTTLEDYFTLLEEKIKIVDSNIATAKQKYG
ncbi:MAG: S16 family serine protease, partial [Candidatus Diapherotrites archaeon]|nr:S16 family serine protease [Candidatus Diapherotrites archaeon]